MIAWMQQRQSTGWRDLNERNNPMSTGLLSTARHKVSTLRRIVRSFSREKEWDALHCAQESDRYQTLEQQPRYWMVRGLCEWTGSNKDVLEIGCGAALLPAAFSPNFLTSYTGLDVSSVALEQAAKRFPSGKYIQGKAEGAIFSEGAFDLIVLNESLYLIRQFSDVFMRYLTYLRPDGYAVISITHIEQDALRSFQERFGPLIRFQDTITDSVNGKSWTVYLLSRPSAGSD